MQNVRLKSWLKTIDVYSKEPPHLAPHMEFPPTITATTSKNVTLLEKALNIIYAAYVNSLISLIKLWVRSSEHSSISLLHTGLLC